jgi:hypothetical protein
MAKTPCSCENHSNVAYLCLYCADSAISLHSHHISLVQWTTRLLPIMRDPGSIPRGVLMWNRDSPVGVVSLHWWPRRDWLLWPRLRGASSLTITSPSCRQCDNPTWSHTALLSRFHACCRFSFRFHNRHSQLLGGSPVESLQSHCIHTMSNWSSGLTICFPSWWTRGQSPGGYLCETRILLLVLSRYITITLPLHCLSLGHPILVEKYKSLLPNLRNHHRVETNAMGSFLQTTKRLKYSGLFRSVHNMFLDPKLVSFVIYSQVRLRKQRGVLNREERFSKFKKGSCMSLRPTRLLYSEKINNM